MNLKLTRRKTYSAIGAITTIGILMANMVMAITITTAPPITLATATGGCGTASVASGVPGFSGQYFNMAETDPGMIATKPYYSGPPIPNPVAGPANYWYSAPYFAFSRVDSNLNFGESFFPVHGNKPGDPAHFAVHWRAQMEVPASGQYKFTMRSNDDSWLYIDGNMVIDLNGIHPAKTSSANVTLTQGLHTIDIYYADRAHFQAVFVFTPDPRLTFYAVPMSCPSGTGVSPSSPITPTTLTTKPSGRVLGESLLPYTPAVALVKTASSPAVYVIYANGMRHYISSPAALAQYGYSFSQLRVVSQERLDSHPDVRLVRTREKATVYFLFQRPDRQWLKFPIPSATVFVSYPKNQWGNIAVIDDLDLNSYPTAKLVRTPGSNEIYLVQNGVRHRFLSTDVFQSLGYNQAEVVDISKIHLESFALGEPIG